MKRVFCCHNRDVASVISKSAVITTIPDDEEAQEMLDRGLYPRHFRKPMLELRISLLAFRVCKVAIAETLLEAEKCLSHYQQYPAALYRTLGSQETSCASTVALVFFATLELGFSGVHRIKIIGIALIGGALSGISKAEEENLHRTYTRRA